jgi:hypothetical protein
LTTRITFGEVYRSVSSLLHSLSHSRYVVPLRLNYVPQLPTLKHYKPMFLNVSNQISHPYTTIGKIMVLYILIFIFLDNKLEPNDSKHSWIEFWFVRTVPKYLNFSTLSKELLSVCILWLLFVQGKWRDEFVSYIIYSLLMYVM